jgi:uncharacterized protein
MNNDLLKRVIADQADEIKQRKNLDLIERESMDFARGFLNENIIKVVTGVRRCGKSTFCHQLLGNTNYAYLNFDDERLIGLRPEDLDKLLETLLIEFPNPDYLLFDEIQNVDGWELFVNRLSRQGANIILTGSNSKMLSRELATHLTGRHIQIELFPFSFSEFLRHHLEIIDMKTVFSTKKISRIRKLLQLYTLYGGFPEMKNLENKQRYVRDLYDKIILRDIVERYKVRDVSTLKEMSILLLNYFSSLFTYNKLCNSLGMGSVNTVKEFAGYLEDTYLLGYVSKHSFKIKEELRSPKKAYIIDSGLLSALGTSLSPNTGRIMENIVYLHERRKGNRINYFSDGKCEVDFVTIDEKNDITLIQVAKDISSITTLQRETNALIKAVEKIKAGKLMIINEDIENTIETSGCIIEIVPLWKYLLMY